MNGVSRLIQVFLTFLLLICSIGVVSASSDKYDFKIIVSYDFDDDEEIECDLKIDDDEDKNFEFSDSDNEYENDFEDTLELDCKEDFDKIKLYVYDDDGDEVDRDSWSDEDKFDYELDLIDEDENWFEIEIDHDFGSSEVDCDLKVDSKSYSYDFDEDTDNDDLVIKKNFDETIEFECDNEFDKIRFQAFDDDGDELEDKDYEDKDGFYFDLEEEEKNNEMKIELVHDFDDDEIKCTLELDNDNKETFEFDEDTDSDDLKIVRDFVEKIEFDCNEKIDEIELRIYDDDGDKVASENYENEDDFEYKFNAGDYEFFIQLDEVTSSKEFDCTLYLDGEKEDKYEFDDSSSIGDRRIEDDFKEDFEFICEKNIDVTLMIFTATDDDEEGEKLFEKNYGGVEKIGYDVKASYIVEEEKEEVPIQEVNVVQEIEKVEPEPAKEESKKEEPTLNTTQITGNVEVQSGQQENTVKETTSTSQKVPVVDNSVKDNLALEESSSFTSIMFGLLLLLLIIIVAVVGLMKAGILEFDSKPKRKKSYRKINKNKKDIDFDFLKKK